MHPLLLCWFPTYHVIGGTAPLIRPFYCRSFILDKDFWNPKHFSSYISKDQGRVCWMLDWISCQIPHIRLKTTTVLTCYPTISASRPIVGDGSVLTHPAPILQSTCWRIYRQRVHLLCIHSR